MPLSGEAQGSLGKAEATGEFAVDLSPREAMSMIDARASFAMPVRDA
jgi:hypothetical protein